MMIAPTADPGDGIFEVMVIRDGPIWQTLAMSATIYSGKHISSPLVSHFRGRQIEAVTLDANPAWLDLDGEAPGILPLTVGILEGALELLGKG